MDYICSFSEVQCTFLLNMTLFMYYFAVILYHQAPLSNPGLWMAANEHIPDIA